MYDQYGNRTAMQTPGIYGTEDWYAYMYDLLNRVTKQIDPLNNEKEYHYNAQNQLTQMIDELDHSYEYAHNAAGKITAVTAPGSIITYYWFDANMNMTARSNPGAISEKYEYLFDTLNRVTMMKDPADTESTFITKYYYDGLNRKTIRIRCQSLKTEFIEELFSKF